MHEHRYIREWLVQRRSDWRMVCSVSFATFLGAMSIFVSATMIGISN